MFRSTFMSEKMIAEHAFCAKHGETNEPSFTVFHSICWRSGVSDRVYNSVDDAAREPSLFHGWICILRVLKVCTAGSFLPVEANNLLEMVLFFCTFVALRSQDGHKRVQDIRDYELEAEKELFGGWVNYIQGRSTLTNIPLQSD